MTEPMTTLDARYSDPAAAPTPWAVTCAALEAAQLAWLVTLRQDGRPHATLVVPVWVDDSMHFTTGATEQKGKNLQEEGKNLEEKGKQTEKRGEALEKKGVDAEHKAVETEQKTVKTVKHGRNYVKTTTEKISK